MPAGRGKPTHIAELMCKSATFLLLFATYHADLIPQLASCFRKRMHMEGRGFWLLQINLELTGGVTTSHSNLYLHIRRLL